MTQATPKDENAESGAQEAEHTVHTPVLLFSGQTICSWCNEPLPFYNPEERY